MRKPSRSIDQENFSTQVAHYAVRYRWVIGLREEDLAVECERIGIESSPDCDTTRVTLLTESWKEKPVRIPLSEYNTHVRRLANLFGPTLGEPEISKIGVRVTVTTIRGMIGKQMVMPRTWRSIMRAMAEVEFEQHRLGLVTC